MLARPLAPAAPAREGRHRQEGPPAQAGDERRHTPPRPRPTCTEAATARTNGPPTHPCTRPARTVPVTTTSHKPSRTLRVLNPRSAPLRTPRYPSWRVCTIRVPTVAPSHVRGVRCQMAKGQPAPTPGDRVDVSVLMTGHEPDADTEPAARLRTVGTEGGTLPQAGRVAFHSSRARANDQGKQQRQGGGPPTLPPGAGPAARNAHPPHAARRQGKTGMAPYRAQSSHVSRVLPDPRLSDDVAPDVRRRAFATRLRKRGARCRC